MKKEINILLQHSPFCNNDSILQRIALVNGCAVLSIEGNACSPLKHDLDD